MKRLKTITRLWGDKLTVTASKKAADLGILTVMCLNRAVYGENKLNRCFYKDKRRATKLLEMMVCYLCIGMNAAFPDGTVLHLLICHHSSGNGDTSCSLLHA